MSILPLDADELARRLGIVADAVSGPYLESALSVSAQMIDPRCDPVKVTANPDAYTEAAYQLGVKVWDTSTRALVGMDSTGQMDVYGAMATSGMWRSVLGVLQPCLPTGGLVVG